MNFSLNASFSSTLSVSNRGLITSSRGLEAFGSNLTLSLADGGVALLPVIYGNEGATLTIQIGLGGELALTAPYGTGSASMSNFVTNGITPFGGAINIDIWNGDDAYVPYTELTEGTDYQVVNETIDGQNAMVLEVGGPINSLTIHVDNAWRRRRVAGTGTSSVIG